VFSTTWRLDVAGDALGLLVVPVQEQPARALRHVAPDEQDPEAHGGREPEAQAPADVGAEQVLVEQDQRRQRAEDRADPVAASDDQVDRAPHARRDELVHGRVDRRVLAADAGSGDEAAGDEPREVHRERGEHAAGEEDRQREHEQPLAADLVSQAAEVEGAETGAEDVRRAGGADL
jgi:hypothetical protein